MWQFAMAPLGAFINSHPLMGGLGGVITIIVGGIASVVAWRSVKRGAARPAPSPEAPPIHRKPAPPISYGAPNPPTSPARRLHPGPISLSPSAPQSEPPNDDAEPGMSHFTPDLLTTAHDETYSAPIWPARGAIAAETRAQTLAAPEPNSMPAPVWTSPRTRVSHTPDLMDETALAMEAPVWRASLLSARLRLSSATATTPDTPEAQPMAAPVWTTRARLPKIVAARAEGDEAAQTTPEAETDTDAWIEPPIWPSRTRRPT